MTLLVLSVLVTLTRHEDNVRLLDFRFGDDSLQDLRIVSFPSFGSFIGLSSQSLKDSYQMERLSSPLVLTSTVFKSLLVVLLFSSLVVDRCATDDDLTSGSNDGLGDGTLDPEFEEELDSHSSCPHLHHYSEHAGDNSSHSCPGVQGFIKSYRVESVKRDILRKLNLDAPPNISVSTIPQVPRLQALIEKVGKDHNSYDDEPKSTFILFGKASGWLEFRYFVFLFISSMFFYLSFILAYH